MPHEGGFAIKVTEKIEDLMMTLFLPLYFTLSGLNTNLGLLDNAKTWAYLVAVTIVAFCSKFFGCAVAARLNGLVWRESFAIGALMSCKGLVELIVLNIGLQAKILSTRVFTMVSLQVMKRSRQELIPRTVRCHGACHHVCHHAAHVNVIPTVVPEEAGSVEAWRNRLGHWSTDSWWRLRRHSGRSREAQGQDRCPKPTRLPSP